MEIGKFLASMLPTISKDKVKEDLSLCLEEFQNHVEPVYKQFYKSFENYKFQNKTLIVFEQKFQNTIEENYSGNFIGCMWKIGIKYIPEKIGFVQMLLEKGTINDFMRDSLSARDINALQLSEILSFMVRYSRRFLNYAITVETNYHNQVDENKTMLIAEVEWINKYYSAFLAGLNFLKTKKGKVTELWDKVPDVLINQANAQEVKAVSGDAVDPYRVGFIPLMLNPIYHIGMKVAEWQAARYHEARFEQQALATKIIYLQKRAQNQNDAKLEKTIEEYDRLLAKKTYELHAMEEKYAK